MITIHLDKLSFFAHHGLHDEEAVIGTDFELSVAVSFEPVEKITSITQTINYAEVYRIIDQHMRHPVSLLESLAENILTSIYGLDERIVNISVNINKLHPPIPGFSGSVGVSISKAFQK